VIAVELKVSVQSVTETCHRNYLSPIKLSVTDQIVRKLIGFVWRTPATNRELTAAIPAEAFLP
jgi:hypothetical protein